MKARIVDRPDGAADVTVDAAPQCGTDFCDACGDCLACYNHDDCWRDGEAYDVHLWIVYADLRPERAAELLAP